MRYFEIDYQENGDSAEIRFAEQYGATQGPVAFSEKGEHGETYEWNARGELISMRIPDGGGCDWTLEEVCDAMRAARKRK